MTVIAVERDPAGRTLRIVAEFQATSERVWQMWADPRKLERWWGPPAYPATFVDLGGFAGNAAVNASPRAAAELAIGAAIAAGSVGSLSGWNDTPQRT